MNLQYKSKKSSLIAILIFVLLLLVLFFLFKQTDSTPPPEVEIPTADALLSEMGPLENDDHTEKEREILFVDLKGAVQKTGVYEMDSGLRVKDVIEKAGGFTKDADVNNVNLSELLNYCKKKEYFVILNMIIRKK